MSVRWTGVVHGSEEESAAKKDGKVGDTQTSEGWGDLIVYQRGHSLLSLVAASR